MMAEVDDRDSSALFLATRRTEHPFGDRANERGGSVKCPEARNIE
jgi:hypothetical protein